MKVVVCDWGAFGAAIGIVLARAGHQVTGILRPSTKKAEFECPLNVSFASDFDAMRHAKVIFLAVSSAYLKAPLAEIKAKLKENPKAVLALLSKGFDQESLAPWGIKLARDLKNDLNFDNFAAISGPTFAHEIIKPYQAHFASVASRNPNTIKKLKTLFKNTDLHLLGTNDLLGVSWGGCLKNAYAIGYGLLLKQAGESAAFEYLRLALKEMEIFLNFAGARPKTLFSPAVERDFYVTSRGDSRNKKFGLYLAGYPSKEEINAELKNATVEGFDAMKILWQIAQSNGLNTPFLRSIHAICEYGASPETFLQCFKNTKALSY